MLIASENAICILSAILVKKTRERGNLCIPLSAFCFDRQRTTETAVQTHSIARTRSNAASVRPIPLAKNEMRVDLLAILPVATDHEILHNLRCTQTR